MNAERASKLPTHGPTLAATSIVLPAIRPEAKRYLQAHSCLVIDRPGSVTVRYPAGTTSTETYPRTGYSHHIITLPDGTELREARPCLSLFLQAPNCLYLPKAAENA